MTLVFNDNLKMFRTDQPNKVHFSGIWSKIKRHNLTIYGDSRTVFLQSCKQTSYKKQT